MGLNNHNRVLAYIITILAIRILRQSYNLGLAVRFHGLSGLGSSWRDSAFTGAGSGVLGVRLRAQG